MRSFLLAIAILSAVPLSLSAEIKQDIVYAKRDGQELQLDIALPAGDKKMRPTIVCIHGGGWKEGKRQSYHSQLQEMSQRGFVVATIDYRLTGVAPWPAQIVDVRDALQWLVQHADDYGNLFDFKFEDVLARDVLGWIAADQERHVAVADGVIVLTQDFQLETRLLSIATLLALSGDSPDELVDEVTSFIFNVDPASWDSSPCCAVTRLGDLLVIRQTASNQDQISALLKQMERALGD